MTRTRDTAALAFLLFLMFLATGLLDWLFGGAA